MVIATFALAGPVRAELPPLIPRDVLFPKPAAMRALQLSPDGRLLSYVAPDGKGVPQLWVRPLETSASRPLTSTRAPGVAAYTWAENSRIICYERPADTGPRIAAVDVSSGIDLDLVAFDDAQFGSTLTRPAVPDEMLLSVRLSGSAGHDLYRLNVTTGAFALDTKNPGGVSDGDFFADDLLRVRAVQRNFGNGGTEVLVRDTASSPWRVWLSVDPTHVLSVEAFGGDGESILLRSDVGSDTARLVERIIRDGKEKVIASSRELDVENVLLHPRTSAVQAVSFLTDPRRWNVLDQSLDADFRALRRLAQHAAFGIAGRDRSDSRWLVWLGDDRSSRRCYLWDRLARRASLIIEEQPQLKTLPLARMKPITVKARDGLRVHGYLILPVGVPARNLPLVVWVHGGPYLRDSWGYDQIGQLFANRGYAFLRLNYRGSRGYGRAFRVAAFKQWGRAMQDDVVDAVEHLVRSGIADRRRMAIMGHSYGAYAALAGLTLTPDLFACGAASSGVANLVAFVSNFPKTPDNAWVRETIGDPEDPKDAEILKSVSPFFLADRVSKPFLLAWGDKDPALPKNDLQAFVEAVRKRGQTAISVVYEGDGHFFRRENQLDFFARAEALLAQHLGGRAEPLNR